MMELQVKYSFMRIFAENVDKYICHGLLKTII